jgi:transcriptional regulator with XRE-family HTH domain
MVLYNKVEAGKRLTEVIADSKLNSGQFAETIGKDPSYLSKMENGKKGISGTFIKAIEEKYGVNRQWLLFGNGPKYGTNVPRESGENLAVDDMDIVKVLANLSESHKNLTAAHKEIAQSNNRLSAANHTLAGNEKMILEKMPTVDVASDNGIDDPSRLVPLVKILAGISSGKLKYRTEQEALAELGIRLSLHKPSRVKAKNTPSGAGK